MYDAQSLLAGLFDALDVLPPVIDGHRGGEDGGGGIHVELEGVVVRVHQSRRKPVAIGRDYQEFVHQSCNVLAGGNAGDGSRQNVVEHQRRDAELGEGAPQGFLHHAVDAAAGKHRTAFDVDRAHRETEEHDAEDEPRSSRAHRLFSDASGIESR